MSTTFAFAKKVDQPEPHLIRSGMSKGHYEIHIGPIQGNSDMKYIVPTASRDMRLYRNIKEIRHHAPHQQVQAECLVAGEWFKLVDWYGCQDSMCCILRKLSPREMLAAKWRRLANTAKSQNKRRQALCKARKYETHA